jgi:beta-phosphoglucomutase
LSCTAVIFDFNGTLFWDSSFHIIAWQKYYYSHNKNLSFDDTLDSLYGKTNKEILENLHNRPLSLNEIEDHIHQKELNYQKLCVNAKLGLAPGSIEFLHYLIEKKIKITIATCTKKENIDFYFSYLNLGRWFDKKLVSYNDGIVNVKPAPDIYIKAYQLLEVNPSDVIVFEDSIQGIKSAENSKAGKIIVVDSHNTKCNSVLHPCIKDFHEAFKYI